MRTVLRCTALSAGVMGRVTNAKIRSPPLSKAEVSVRMSRSKTIIVIALGSAGDVHPNVALAVALKRRGHSVLLVSSVVFEPLARRVGLEFAGLGGEAEYYDVINNPDLRDPSRTFTLLATRMIVPAMREVYSIVAKT
jgi:UDP:flavonoid glycosyltransferase YjiC (YdhE family)